ncbi:PAS/PAC sensor signal transduction histidine kinase [Natrialba chahannaoensis JCM 10990]|uniref:histidine kinase n=1 Tax=Natrialba chahannaoensis JCM 10990 TaxID=1227492 RepID=M0ARF9_9EURY|nr:PAS domain-containing protein [Natrialba chahannaoensis]ELZ00917.1 PAS/PAC sensor signal transduction histidine kinase [Natrialba chahannaoensis JCM 10990]
MTGSSLTDALRETLVLFEAGGAPLTTAEVAEQLDLGRQSTYERLERLVDHDRLETKTVGANGRVWWQPSTNGHAFTTGRQRNAIDSDLGEVFDRISDGFYALDDELRFRYLNDRAADLLGLDEAVIGTDIRNGNLTKTFENALYDALETQAPVTFEDHHSPWEKWLQIVIYPSESGLSVYSRDITERKRRERELARYETIVETSPIGITIVGSDGEMQFANDRAEEIYGRSKDEINDLSFDDPNWSEVDVDGEPLPDDEKPFLQIMERGEPVLDHLSGVSRPDGERVWISVNGAPVYDDCEEIDSVVFSIEDITDRFERERKLEQYETVVETAHDGIYVLDEERQFELVNESFADLTSFSRTALLGQHVSAVFDGEFASPEAEQWESEATDELPLFEETITAGPNETQTVENRFVFLDEDSQEQQIGVTRDVTQREEYRQQLVESNERLSQFAYAVSHDLQEPLRMVTSYLQLLERRYGDDLDEDADEFIDYAVDGAERMREMIDDLLEYSRVGTQGDPFEPVELNEVINDACTDLQLQIENSDAHIESGSLPQVSGDKGQLCRVFQNVLSNAIEYSGDDPPRIAVSAERDGSKWRISVRDEGIGIDPEKTDRIFEVFQRLHSRDESEGTGIGLALCRRIIERHDGEIWVESEPGEGSTFSFMLSPAHDTE